MDLVRSCSRRASKFFTDADVEIPIQWYRCPPGAKFFPVPHKWGSLEWYSHPWTATGVGVVYDRSPTWKNGATPAGVTGQHFHGPIEFFQEGCNFDSTHFTSRNNQGVDTECTGEPPVPPPVVLNLCGGGTYYLSRTLRMDLIPKRSAGSPVAGAPDVGILMEYDELDGFWKGSFSTAATPQLQMTRAYAKYSPTFNSGWLEVWDYCVRTDVDPDCPPNPSVKILLTNTCFGGLTRRNPFEVGYGPNTFFVVGPDSASYSCNVHDPADD